MLSKRLSQLYPGSHRSFRSSFTIAGMGWHYGAGLAKAIRARACAANEVKKAEARLAQIAIDVQSAEKAHEEAKARVAELDEQLRHRWKIDPNLIRPISRQTSRLIPSHGALTSVIFEYMRSAKRAVSTTEIRGHLAGLFGLPSGTTKQREESRRMVTRRLRQLAAAGWMKPLHKPRTNRIGKWALVKRPRTKAP